MKLSQCTKILHAKDIYQDMKIYHNMEIFHDMEGLVWKRVEFHVEIQDIEIIQDMEIILDMEVKCHTLYRTTIGRRKQIYRQVYNIYAYILH